MGDIQNVQCPARTGVENHGSSYIWLFASNETYLISLKNQNK